MTHLYIELNTGLTEEVNSSIISKLYELAISGDLDNTSDLKGRLHSSTAKDAHVAYLNEEFDDLYITADMLYMTFADPEVERVLMATGHIGDGVGISLSDCATYGNYDNYTVQFSIFQNNTTIEYFPEFKYFTYWINKGGQNWFNGCTNLKNIDITGCTNIVYSAFTGCSLSEFNIQQLSSVQTIGLFCFLNSGISGEINLPSLQNIYANAFFNCAGITKVSSLGSITELRNNTFSRCSNLTQVELPTTCTNIGDSVFYKCGSLSTINEEGTLAVTGALVLSHISTLGGSVFAETGITSADFTGCTFTSVGAGMFSYCSNLTTVVLPNTVTSIRYDTFMQCPSLQHVNLPTVCTSIYMNAFNGCSNLDETYDLSNITSLGQGAFNNCNKLKISNFPRLSTYNGNTFRGIANTSITIPKEVSSIGGGCFANLQYLQTITFESGSLLTLIEYDGFASCPNLLSIVLPEGLTTIGSNCFYNCDRLYYIELPSTLISIANGQYFGSLNNFAGSSTIIFRGTTPPSCSATDTGLFGQRLLQSISIYVPDASVDTYKAHAAFSHYADRIFGISQLPNS